MIGHVLFNAIFWPFFGFWLTILYPIVYFSSPKTTLKLAYRSGTKVLLVCLKYLCGIDYQIKNLDILKDLLKKSPVIIGCNHQSTWETFFFSMLFDEVSIVAKKELFSLPVAGLYFKRLKCIPVDRKTPVSAIKSLLKYGKEALMRGDSILIFPNGTRNSFEETVEYKSGIYALYKTLCIPVLPVHVDSGKYWPRRSFKKKKGTIILDFKSPIYPSLNKEEFFNAFEERINAD